MRSLMPPPRHETMHTDTLEDVGVSGVERHEADDVGTGARTELLDEHVGRRDAGRSRSKPEDERRPELFIAAS